MQKPRHISEWWNDAKTPDPEFWDYASCLALVVLGVLIGMAA